MSRGDSPIACDERRAHDGREHVGDDGMPVRPRMDLVLEQIGAAASTRVRPLVYGVVACRPLLALKPKTAAASWIQYWK